MGHKMETRRRARGRIRFRGTKRNEGGLADWRVSEAEGSSGGMGGQRTILRRCSGQASGTKEREEGALNGGESIEQMFWIVKCLTGPA
jgi:hypothetical protein